MKADHWERAEEILNAALALPQDARGAFVERECDGETALLSEVQTLLHSFESAPGFLDEPIFDLGLTAINDKPLKDLSGSTIGFYEIVEHIGSGGMGEVYRATDTRLNRRVALKFLTDSLENNKDAKRQLIKEAQAVAMLEHPNICAVHGIEQVGELQFIAMQYIDGRTLGEYIAEEDRSLDESESITRQILTAVAYAHSHGVIHRDLKPGNIMLTNDGKVKILDFGLAKVLPQQGLIGGNSTSDVSRFSQNGSIIGTVAYMSPEQLRGEKLDYRSDIFSVGIVLYEMLSGRNPFKRDSHAETIAAILSSEPVRLTDTAKDLPRSLAAIVERCLAKDRNERFQSAAELIVELDQARPDTGGDLVSQKRRRLLAVAAILSVLLFVTVWFGMPFWAGTPTQRTLAVMPLSFDSAEKEYLADGLSQSLRDKLTSLSSLKVKSEYFVTRFKGKQFDSQTVGKELGVDAVYSGEIVSRETSLILISKLVRVSDGLVLDTDEQPIDENKLIELQEAVATRIAGKVKSGLSDDDLTKLAKKETDNPEAKLLYFRGRYAFERQQGDDLMNAALSFQRAVDLDSTYAKAWTGLADTFALMGVPGHKRGSWTPEEMIRNAKYAALQANELDPDSAEPKVSLAMIKLRFDWDWDEAERNFNEAIRRKPDLPSAHLGLSNLLIIKGRFAESLDEARIAKELLPFSPIPDLSLARTYSFERNWTEMDRVLTDALTRYPDHKRLTYFRGLLYLRTERYAEAIGIFEKLYVDDKIYGAAPLAWAYAHVGRKNDATNILKTLESISKTEPVGSQEWAWIYLALGERDTAFEYMRHACEERFSVFPFALIDPAMDEVRNDPRLPALRRCANLE